MAARRRIGGDGIDDLPSRVRSTLARWTGDRPPSTTEVAMVLGVSARTLQRRLRESGTSYRGLLGEALRARAERMLLDPGIDVAEVAARLGFTDASNFCRAFRRWTGTSPGEFRGSRRFR
jgi:AraC-like DNA-binding protein